MTEHADAPLVGKLLAQAMAARAARLGRAYSYRDLEVDSGVNHAYIHRVVRGERHPSREVIRALVGALGEDFPLDAALLAAGYAPEERRALVRLVVALPPDRLAEAERRLRDLLE